MTRQTGVRYADVIVNISSLNKSFQYSIPPELVERVVPGSAVLIPFGNAKEPREGYVIGISAEPKIEPSRIRPLAGIPEGRVTIESKLIRLAVWMHHTYGAGIQASLRTVLPVREKTRQTVRGTIRLAISDEEAGELLETCVRRHYAAKERLIRALLEEGEIERAEAIGSLHVGSDTLKKMVNDGILTVSEYTKMRDPLELTDPEEGQIQQEAELSEEQRNVVRGIEEEWEAEDRPVLIRGVTGSGKTLVYMELADRVLKEGRQVIILIPEISLSWQTVRRFRRRFGEEVTVLNSRMSKGERYDQFEKMKKGDARIVIGPRSALFVPFPDPGLIIIDEEQEPSYRNENAPRYDTREAAVYRASLENAHVVFGSATPSLDTYYRAEKGEYALFRLDNRYGSAELPEVSIVDMREELKAGNRSILSIRLQEKIADRLAKKEQVMLFLNRRGYSGVQTCRSCGHVIKCPHCDISLTLHTNGRMICHFCGYETPAVKACPSCGSHFISGFSYGTEKVEADLNRLFPEARVIRMDKDTTREKESYGKLLKNVADRKADILLGTQMIVKGHDFPGITLVGVLAADLSLHASDYRAEERTYQLLVQAVGRSGRGDGRGEAIIQTYNPESECIRDAVSQSYNTFYEREILAREMLDTPPAGNLLAIHGSARDPERLDRAMQAVHSFLLRYEPKKQFIGPAPEPVSRKKDMYLSVLYVRQADLQRLVWLRRMTDKFISMNEGFRNVSFQYDVNA